MGLDSLPTGPVIAVGAGLIAAATLIFGIITAGDAAMSVLERRSTQWRERRRAKRRSDRRRPESHDDLRAPPQPEPIRNETPAMAALDLDVTALEIGADTVTAFGRIRSINGANASDVTLLFVAPHGTPLTTRAPVGPALRIQELRGKGPPEPVRISMSRAKFDELVAGRGRPPIRVEWSDGTGRHAMLQHVGGHLDRAR